jgi:DNA-binding MarR family transcriptional regulator
MPAGDRLIYLVSIAQQALRARVNAGLKGAGLRLTLAQSAVLFLLLEKDRRMMSELGEVIGVDNSSITRLIDNLEKNGFAVRKTDPRNRRAIRIHITAAGKEEAGKARGIISSVNREIKTGFTDGELDAFRRVLRGILELKET